MAIKTTKFQIGRALSFFKTPDIFFAIGKTSPWVAGDYVGQDVPQNPEKQPPAPNGDSIVKEVVGYRKADKVLLVTPHDGSSVPPGTQIIESTANTQWRVVSEAEAYTLNAKYVYIETTIQPTDFPSGEYRQVGVFTGTTRKSGVAVGKLALLPSEVQDAGKLEIIDNREKNIRNSATKEFLSYVIKF
ncbi:baseplate protein [Bacillus phage YungSlug]|nr:baseplate protein [Bacillus phage YungSlug]